MRVSHWIGSSSMPVLSSLLSCPHPYTPCSGGAGPGVLGRCRAPILFRCDTTCRVKLFMH